MDNVQDLMPLIIAFAFIIGALVGSVSVILKTKRIFKGDEEDFQAYLIEKEKKRAALQMEARKLASNY